MGHDPLNEMMKTLSEGALLSQIYTNYSVRATCLTKLDEAGFEIQAVTGHKSEESRNQEMSRTEKERHV